MTSLRRTLAGPTVLLAIAAAGALAYLGWDAEVVSRSLEADAARVRAATGLTLALTDAIREEERRVGAAAMPAGLPPDLSEPDARIARLLGEIGALRLPPSSRAGVVWIRFLEAREQLRPLRDEVIAAARAGDPAALERAVTKWHLLGDRADALLADFNAYHLKALDRAVARLERRHARGLRVAAGTVALGLALAVAFSLRVARTVVRPMKEIARAAERVTATGPPAPVAGAERTDEIGVLARSFNAMTARLVAANADLAEAVRARDEFISVASHELRTPLTPLQLRVQHLVRALESRTGGGEDAAEVVRAGRNLEKHVTRLGKLVDAMLDVSRITSGRLALRVGEVWLSEVVRDALDRVGDELEAARCPTRIECEEDVLVQADRARVEQVLVNLAGNAARYAPGAPVVIRIAAAPGAAVLEVEDAGPGIPEADHDRVFTRFERVGVDRHEASGLGLGLYIAREIARAHGGDIVLRSRPGAGATFAVHLPHPPASSPRRPQATGAPRADPGARPG